MRREHRSRAGRQAAFTVLLLFGAAGLLATILAFTLPGGGQRSASAGTQPVTVTDSATAPPTAAPPTASLPTQTPIPPPTPTSVPTRAPAPTRPPTPRPTQEPAAASSSDGNWWDPIVSFFGLNDSHQKHSPKAPEHHVTQGGQGGTAQDGGT